MISLYATKKAYESQVLHGFAIALLLATTSECFGQAVSSFDPNPPFRQEGQLQPTKSRRMRRDAEETLPSILYFESHPSDRFLIDWEHLRTGHPYLGTGAQRPHTGAHLYFAPPTMQRNQARPETYPPIYAVADGIVSRVDHAFRLRPIYVEHLGKTQSNVRYGIDLAIARDQGETISFHYSIEPMTDPGDPEFYTPFIKVHEGDRVKKGDLIAYMYIPEDPRLAENSHIHFNLNKSQRQGGVGFQSPSIFQKEVMERFAKTWDRQRLADDWPIPACMGWRLDAKEDPFVAARSQTGPTTNSAPSPPNLSPSSK